MLEGIPPSAGRPAEGFLMPDWKYILCGRRKFLNPALPDRNEVSHVVTGEDLSRTRNLLLGVA